MDLSSCCLYELVVRYGCLSRLKFSYFCKHAICLKGDQGDHRHCLSIIPKALPPHIISLIAIFRFGDQGAIKGLFHHEVTDNISTNNFASINQH